MMGWRAVPPTLTRLTYLASLLYAPMFSRSSDSITWGISSSPPLTARVWPPAKRARKSATKAWISSRAIKAARCSMVIPAKARVFLVDI